MKAESAFLLSIVGSSLTCAQTKLFTSSEVPIYQIFSDDPTGQTGHVSDHMRGVMDDLVCFWWPVP